jgi:hypothetical protein
VLAVTDSDHDDAGFRTAAARNPKRVIERPDFFLGFDFQNGE